MAQTHTHVDRSHVEPDDIHIGAIAKFIVVLTIVTRLALGPSPTANLAVEGTMSGKDRESQNARKPTPTPGFLAKSNTCSG